MKILLKTIIPFILYNTISEIKGDPITLSPDSIIYFEHDKQYQHGISIKNILLAD